MPIVLAASPASAADTDIRVTEVNPRASDTGLGDDWVELTNFGASAVSISGWKVDDDSNGFATGGPISGITSIAPGESVIIVTEGSASSPATFKTQWFGASPPASLQVGWTTGSGLGLGASGDQVNVFNAGGTRVSNVSFGSSAGSSPWASFDNSAGTNGALATRSSVGVNSAFLSSAGTEIGSPGNAGTGGPTPTTTTAPPTTTTTAPPGPTFDPWPGSPTVVPIEDYAFGPDLSGLDYEGTGSAVPGVLWAARNKAGTLFRLVYNGTKWVPDTANNWGAGKDLLYPSGTGHPDSEGLTFVGDTSTGGIYIASERNNDASSVSRSSVLRYDVTGSTPTLTAAQEWDLTADLPVVGPNLGLEGITWIDDTYLVARNFFDESKGHAYNPAEYPNHGTGLFFVAVEGTSTIYAYALETTGAITRIATFGADLNLVTDVQFDRDEQKLWAECDNTCNGRMSVLEVNPSTGHFEVTNRYQRPATLGDNNNEGFAIAPATYCQNGVKPVYWADDNETNGDSIIAGTLPCNDGPAPVVPEFPSQALPILTVGGVVAAAWLFNRRRSLRVI